MDPSDISGYPKRPLSPSHEILVGLTDVFSIGERALWTPLPLSLLPFPAEIKISLVIPFTP